MSAFTALFLGTAGLLGGVITAIVGGSSIICFPAMLAAGRSPVVASASPSVWTTFIAYFVAINGPTVLALRNSV
jgi:hypothetical protein